MAATEVGKVRSKPTHEKQYDEDDQNDADDTNAAVPVAIAVAAEAATEATKQEDDEEDDEYESDGHDLSPVSAPNRTLNLFALDRNEPGTDAPTPTVFGRTYNRICVDGLSQRTGLSN
jgi:hypothetical protein